MHRLLLVEVVLLELIHDLLRSNLTLLLGDLLDHICKLLVHALRQFESVERIHNEGYATLSGLAVDTNDRLVLTTNIGRIDRQIRNLPDLASALMQSLHTLVDCILMRTGECGKYELTCIRMSRIDVHLCATLVNLCDLTDVLDIQLRIDSLREHVVSQSQDIYITGTLTVSEQSSLYTVCACKQCQLGSCHAGSTVIVRMYAQDHAVTILEVTIHPLDLVCINIRSVHLNGGRQVEDDRLLRSCLTPGILNSGTYLKCIIQLSSGKALRRILKHQISVIVLRILLDHVRSIDCDLLDLLFVLVEYHVTL